MTVARQRIFVIALSLPRTRHDRRDGSRLNRGGAQSERCALTVEPKQNLFRRARGVTMARLRAMISVMTGRVLATLSAPPSDRTRKGGSHVDARPARPRYACRGPDIGAGFSPDGGQAQGRHLPAWVLGQLLPGVRPEGEIPEGGQPRRRILLHRRRRADAPDH